MVAGYLFAAAAAAEAPVFGIQLTRGEFGSAAATGAFLIFDSIEAATTVTRLLYRGRSGVRVLDDVALTGDVVRNSARVIDESGAVVGELSGGFDDVAVALDQRVLATGTDVSSGSELAFLQATTKDRTRLDIIASGRASADQADDYLNIYYDDLYQSLSPAEQDIFDATAEAMRITGAPEAYARWGNRIFDEANPGTLRADLLEFGEACRLAASFGGATLVVMADGTRRRIDTITVGDRVRAWDQDTGTTVVETVTATLPHTDTLLTAEFSDGARVQVTEDHVFFNATTNTWSEIRYVEPGDQLLNPDGQQIGLVGLDWDTAVTTSAYHLSVSDEHNYFITASDEGATVLVHNMDLGTFCGVRGKEEYSSLAGADRLLAQPQREALTAVLEALQTTNPVALDELFQALTRNSDNVATLVARAGEFPDGLASAAKLGSSADYLDSVLLWSDEAIDFVGEVSRTVYMRTPGPDGGWGVTGEHLDKHLLGDGDVSLLEKDPDLLFGNIEQYTQDLLSQPLTRGPNFVVSEVDGVTREFFSVEGRFPLVGSPDRQIRLGIVLHVRPDGAFDFVTWQTNFDVTNVAGAN